MIDIVINYNKEKQMYGIYESSTDTYMLSANLSEGLVYLEKFLKDTKLINTGLLESTNISYNLDSYSMKAMIESNVALMKRLNSAPSGFMISQQKFGGSNIQQKQKQQTSQNNKGHFGKRTGFTNSKFKESYKKFKS